MYKHFFKRIIDFMLSLIGIIVLAPLMLILAIAIKVDSKGPVFFRQKRVGIHKKTFTILKFRTMRVDTPHDSPTHELTDPKKWITKVGGFLRKTSLDEIPQIFNIFIGNMSVIGPRPALWNQCDLLEERDKYSANDVKPGLTGWAQINGRDELEIPVKAKLDGEYVAKLGFVMDIKCFFGTFFSVLRSKGVVEGGTGELNAKKSISDSDANSNNLEQGVFTKKKIFVVCQYYYPEPFRIPDICEEWVRQGNEVTVVTGLPNYPMGKIYDGYKSKKKRNEVINGVKVHRCFEIARRKGPIFRLLNYYSFAISSKKYIKKIKEKFDIVFINQLSPVMMAKAGLYYKKKFGVKCLLYCLDLWPESLVAGGIKRGSFLYNHFHKVSKKIYQGVDQILITSKSFKEYLMENFDIPEAKIAYLAQYAESLFNPDACVKIKDDKVDLLFAGNIGTAQSVDTIIRVAEKTKDIKNLRWHIVGDGIELENCQALVKQFNLDNVIFYGRKPLEDMPTYYKMADAMLVTLIDDEVLSLTLPGKVQTYMATGKPIIASANGEIKTVIEKAQCGYVSKAQDVDSFAQNVRKFCEEIESDSVKKFAENSLKYYNENFSREVFFEKLEEVMK